MSATRTEAESVESAPLIPEVLRRNSSFINADSRDISPIVSERRDSITVRRPLQYGSLNENASEDGPDEQTRALLNRYKYYNKLSASAENREDALVMPHHVVPERFFAIIPIKDPGEKQSSVITIFSIWNTMMGTSVLSMPWALGMAGFSCGIVTMMIMAGITLYTAYRVMNSIKSAGSLAERDGADFPDVCRYYLGRVGEGFGIGFSVVTLLGAAIVYWVLMSNFLYNSVTFIYEEATHEMNSSSGIVIDNTTIFDAYCPNPPWHNDIKPVTIATTTALPNTTSPGYSPDVAHESPRLPSLQQQIILDLHRAARDATFDKVWDQTLSVPFFLVIILFPLINIKSPTFFTKLNALGTISVLYILTFVAVKAGHWGIHVDFNDSSSVEYIPQFEWTFPALTGTLSLALFIHNCVISIMRTQRNPENNGRDLSIAYVCVVFTYLFIGIMFYISFPLPKDCIEDNLLNNFRNSDLMSCVARFFLFAQMVTVFPLLMYILRAQSLSFIFGDTYPSWRHVLVVNVIVISCCVAFAIFIPQIGTIIRFSGAICGLAYIFTLPCVVHLMILRRAGRLTWPQLLVHGVLIALGVANFVAQFVIV